MKTLVAAALAEWIKNTPDGAKVLEAHRALMAKVRGGM